MTNEEKVFNILKRLNNIENNLKVDSKEGRRLIDVIEKESISKNKQGK